MSLNRTIVLAAGPALLLILIHFIVLYSVQHWRISDELHRDATISLTIDDFRLLGPLAVFGSFRLNKIAGNAAHASLYNVVPEFVQGFLRSFLLFLPWLVLAGLALNIDAVFRFGVDAYSVILFAVAILSCALMALELRVFKTFM